MNMRKVIAYNEHRSAPALSKRAAMDPDVFENDRQSARNAARNRRRKLAKVKGPAQPKREPLRVRAQIRHLQREGRKAAQLGQAKRFERIATELGALIKRTRLARTQRVVP